MNVKLNSISGIDDAIVSMFISKRTHSPELEEKIRAICDKTLDSRGFVRENALCCYEDARQFAEWMNTLCKWGWQHTTMLRFIDFSFTVEGLHRAGQDDWDSHAKRFNNRIIRSSTRLATYQNEMSDWYKGKIIPTDEALSSLNIDCPEQITVDGVTYVKAVNGYIREDLKDNKDVKRGLYMLSIPSTFVFKVDLTEWAHVYKERGEHGHANPEVKMVAEKIADLIEENMPWFNRDLFMKIKN